MPTPDPDLTPAQERAVRAQLADARHDEPVPDDVAARLDATLAGLVADRNGDTSSSDERVVELRSRRRKVTAGLLAAAAVVVVGGVVGGQVLGDGSVLPTISGSAGSAGGAESAEESDSAGDAERDERSRGSGRDGIEDNTLAEEFDAQSGTHDSPVELAARGGPTVDPDSFSADAERLRRQARTTASYSQRDSTTTRRAEGACPVSAGRGRRVLVTYEGQPGVLVYRAPRAGRQQVELHLCGSQAPRRVAEIPGP